jgi:hypothetical protein
MGQGDGPRSLRARLISAERFGRFLERNRILVIRGDLQRRAVPSLLHRVSNVYRKEAGAWKIVHPGFRSRGGGHDGRPKICAVPLPLAKQSCA